ncbi:NAD(P)-dependent oxidoreductase [Candidatus Pacearchaeota archaeon]|nr:MAG: NAD(P)-dependent oxidoreductase [Candidatus Pacearchaeota archaeon]
MKILVTGGCGFIGSEVVRQLLKKGYDVTVVDDFSKPRSSFVRQDYKFVNIDLTDKEKTEKLFRGQDLCIHLAAKIGGIGYFHKNPAMILSENNKIYSSVFEAASKANISRMIYISSSMVFERADRFPTKEEDLSKIPLPLSSYGFSKLIGEQYCKAFQEQFKLNYSICRPFNAYGINEYPEEEVGYAHVIPDLIKKTLETKTNELEILGDGQQSRCFTHVRDVAEGIITIMENPKAVNQDFNVSSPHETKIIDLAKEIWFLCGKKEEPKFKFIPGFKYDVKKRTPDVTKMEEILGWKAKIKLKDGLKEVVEWVKTIT